MNGVDELSCLSSVHFRAVGVYLYLTAYSSIFLDVFLCFVTDEVKRHFLACLLRLTVRSRCRLGRLCGPLTWQVGCAAAGARGRTKQVETPLVIIRPCLAIVDYYV